MKLQLEAMALELPQVAGHPNRLPFRGVLTLVGLASQHSPAGARGHRVALGYSATEAALPSLLGMALDYSLTMDGHDARRKTLSPLVTTLLAKEGVEGDSVIDAPIMEKALAGLSIEQRIAVKAELARAGILV